MSLLCDTRQPIPLSVGQQHQLLPSCKGWRDAILGRCAWAFGGLVPVSDSTIPASKLLECWLLSAAVLPFAPLALPATITHLQSSTHPCVIQEVPAVFSAPQAAGAQGMERQEASQQRLLSLRGSPEQVICRQGTSHDYWRLSSLAPMTAVRIDWCRWQQGLATPSTTNGDDGRQRE